MCVRWSDSMVEYVVITKSYLSNSCSTLALLVPWYTSTRVLPSDGYSSISPGHWIGAATGQMIRVARVLPGRGAEKDEGMSAGEGAGGRRAWMVFPMPISSARMPPLISEEDSCLRAHASHSFWNWRRGRMMSGGGSAVSAMGSSSWSRFPASYSSIHFLFCDSQISHCSPRAPPPLLGCRFHSPVSGGDLFRHRWRLLDFFAGAPLFLIRAWRPKLRRGRVMGTDDWGKKGLPKGRVCSLISWASQYKQGLRSSP